MNHCILIVDDEPDYLDLLYANLRVDGYEVLTARNGEEALNMLIAHPVHLVLLDVVLPDVDGITLCQRIRTFSRLPVIMLTARASEEERVRGLDAGADDYISKPFSITELLARVRAVLRRVETRHASSDLEPVIEYGDLRVDLGRAEVWKRGQPVSLSPTEYRLLLQFLLHRGKVLSTPWLLRNVWGAGYENEREVLWVTIARLRQKIEDDPRRPRYVLTRPGEGYWMP
ncbi:MAG: response regulator transcription factor [Anaerolineales bacterium]